MKKKYSLLLALLASLLFIAILTWIIPSGSYSYGTFTKGEIAPLGIGDLLKIPLWTFSTIFQFTLIFLVIGGFYGVLNKTSVYSNLVESVSKKFKKKPQVFLIITVVSLALLSSVMGGISYLFLLVPFFVFSITTLFYDTKISVVFRIFGKQSTNIWLSHTFWCYYFWQPIVFFPYFSTAIYIWFAILSLITSFAINLILIPINNLFFSKEHRLSYKGYFKME